MTKNRLREYFTIFFFGGIIYGLVEVVSRGFVYVKEAESLMNEAVVKAMNIIDSFPPYSFDLNAMNTKLRDEISRLMYERTKRSPMILPILMEV